MQEIKFSSYSVLWRINDKIMSIHHMKILTEVVAMVTSIGKLVLIITPILPETYANNISTMMRRALNSNTSISRFFYII